MILGSQHPQDERRPNGRSGGDRLDDALDPIDGKPERDDGHQVGCSTGQDKPDEKIENPAVLEVGALPHKIDQRRGHEKIGQCGDRVGYGVQSHQTRRPTQAESVRGKPRGIHEPIPNRHDPDLHPGPPRLDMEIYQRFHSSTISTVRPTASRTKCCRICQRCVNPCNARRVKRACKGGQLLRACYLSLSIESRLDFFDLFQRRPR